MGIVKQAFFAAGVGNRPKSKAVWAVRAWEKHSFQAHKNQPSALGTFGASKVQAKKIKIDDVCKDHFQTYLPESPIPVMGQIGA